MKKSLVTMLLAGAFAVGMSAQANASPGFIALEGSDATAFHQDPSYTPELFHYLQGSSKLNVLVYDSSGTIGIANPGGVGITYTTTLSGVTLSNYSALYIEAPGGCCSSNPNALNGFGAAVSAFIAAGGNFSIENYMGGSFDGVVPGGLGHSAGDGTIVGVGCSDGEVVNANGLAKGFTQPPIDGCWSHQGYEDSYWQGLGYVNLIDAARAYGPYADGTFNGSSLLAFGGTLGTVPEPITFSLFGAGLAGVAALRGRKNKKKAA